MATQYIDPQNIFASDAPTQDKPPAFNNYIKGMDETRSNDGRPTIKQFNFIQQQNDFKFLYIHERGACLPFVEGFPYENNAIVFKDGFVQQKNGASWIIPFMRGSQNLAELTDVAHARTKLDVYSKSEALAEVNGVRQELDAHIEDLLNPHQVTKGQIGLGNVDNTADADKPVSNSAQAAIISAVAPKADKSSVYTKSETYSRQETQGLVDDKISTTLFPISSEIEYIERYTPLPYKLQNYAVGQRVTLSTGEIVENRVPNNNVDPNTDMLGWVKVNNATIVVGSVFELLALNQNQIKPKVMYKTKAFYDGNNYGSAFYYWDSNKSKLEANGGTIIDPANTGGFDGTYTTIESFLSAQGAGLGAGCWVCTSSKADTTRFGLHKSYDISASLQKSIDYAKTNRNSGKVILPSGLLTLSKKVSANFGGTTATAIILEGQGTQTQIMSNVIGATSLEFVDASSCKLKDLILYGNGELGIDGSGHGIVFKGPVGAEEHLPNGCVFENVVVRGFKGSDVDASGNSIRSSGVYMSGGTLCQLNGLKVIDNFHGVYLDSVGPITFGNFLGSANLHSSVFAYNLARTLFMDKVDIVSALDQSTSVTLGGYTIPAAAICIYNTLGTVEISKVRVKGNGVQFRFVDVRKVTIDGGDIMLPYDSNPSVHFESTGTFTRSLTVRDVTMHSTVPQTGNHKGILVKSTQAGWRSDVSVQNCRINLTGTWDYILRIENTASTDRTRFDFDKNFIFGGTGPNPSILNAAVHVENGRVFGDFTNNTTSLRQSIAGHKIVSYVTTNTTNPQELLTQGNVEAVFSPSVVENPLRTNSVSGAGVFTSTTGGLITIPVNLNSNPVRVYGQLDRLSNALKLFPDALNAQSKDNLRFYAYNLSDGLPYVGTVNMYYEANTLP